MTTTDTRKRFRSVALTLAVVCGLLACSCALSSALSMPDYTGDNGIVARGHVKPWFENESLRDWTIKPDFIAVAVVESQDRIESSNPEFGSDPEFWNAIQNVSIDRVVWRRPDGVAPAENLRLIGSGWSRNNDTGKVSPLVPAEGARLDVGDHFVAAFVNVAHFLEADEAKSYVAEFGTKWATFGSTGVLHLDAGGHIMTNDRTPDYEKNLDGLSVAEFTQRLQSVVGSQETTTTGPG